MHAVTTSEATGRRTIVLLALALFFATAPGVRAADEEQADTKIRFVEYDRYPRFERNGIKFYKRGKFDKAFPKLSDAAAWGLKDAQYYLGLMFLKGQHVEPSVVLGMGWLGVANEAGVEEWQATYDGLYAAASPELQARIDEKVLDYVAKYGQKVQRVSCVRRARKGSRKIRIECTKRHGTLTHQPEVELRDE